MRNKINHVLCQTMRDWYWFSNTRKAVRVANELWQEQHRRLHLCTTEMRKLARFLSEDPTQEGWDERIVLQHAANIMEKRAARRAAEKKQKTDVLACYAPGRIVRLQEVRRKKNEIRPVLKIEDGQLSMLG